MNGDGSAEIGDGEIVSLPASSAAEVQAAAVEPADAAEQAEHEAGDAPARILAEAERLITVFGFALLLLRPFIEGRCTCGSRDPKHLGKHPINEGWSRWPISTVDELRAQYARNPGAGIGIVTGVVSRLLVIDVDGDIGAANFERVSVDLGLKTDGPRVRTSRGHHYYYRSDSETSRNTAGDSKRGLGKDIDVRSNGGYVVAVPSPHSSGTSYAYELADGSLSSVSPDALEARPYVSMGLSEKIEPEEYEAPASLPLPFGDRSGDSDKRDPAYFAALLDSACANIASAPVGTRNDTLNREAHNVACAVYGGKIDNATARRRLFEAALKSGLGKLEITNTIKSAFEAARTRGNLRYAPTKDRPKPNGAGAHVGPGAVSGRVPLAAVTTDSHVPEPEGPDEPSMAGDVAPQVPAYQLLADAVPSLMRPLGPRLTTGIVTLDAALRGGLPARRLCVIQGPPGSGKTTLIVSLGYKWASEGVPVVWLAADEVGSSVATRIGQLCGIERDALESDSQAGEAARVDLVAAVNGLPIVIIDPAADGGTRTIEDAERALFDVAGGDHRRVLIVDSIQTASSSGAEEIDSVRGRIDHIVKVALRGAVLRGAIVIAISEVGRGLYRSQDRSQRIDPLAGSKESGSIESNADVLLSLSSVKGGDGLIDIVMPKNRLGTKSPFRLKQDFMRASFEEVALPSEDDAEAEAAAKADAKDATKRRAAEQHVRDAVLGNIKLKSQRALLAACEGDRNVNAWAFHKLERDGVLVKEGGFFRLRAPTEAARED